MTVLWNRRGACIAALRPAYGDVVVVTTLNGKVAALDRIGDYDSAIDRALKLAAKPRGPVKVLPMTMGEAMCFCGITIDEFMADTTEVEWREHCIRVCTPALANSDPRVRADALAVLTDLGVAVQ